MIRGTSTFKVDVSLKGFPKEDPDIKYEGVISDKINNVNITLELDKIMASNFLFKFTPYKFKYKDYTIIYKNGNPPNIIFTDKDNIYILMDTINFLNDIHKGYVALMVKEKVDSIFNTDFESIDNIIDDEIIEEDGCS